MVAVLTLLAVIVVSLLVVRVATVALILTGLSADVARFEARSAFTSTGFTTKDSEKIVNHPVRRRIVMTLMLLGNAGIVTVISALIASFTGQNQPDSDPRSFVLRGVLLFAGLAVVYAVAHSPWIDKQLSKIVTWALKRFTRIDHHDYVGLLHLARDYAVVEINVNPGNWMGEKELHQLRLSDEGVLVLGIEKKNGIYLGAPKGNTKVDFNDTILVYGPQTILADLDTREAGSKGNWAHHRAVEKQLRTDSEENTTAISPRERRLRAYGRRQNELAEEAAAKTESVDQSVEEAADKSAGRRDSDPAIESSDRRTNSRTNSGETSEPDSADRPKPVDLETTEPPKSEQEVADQSKPRPAPLDPPSVGTPHSPTESVE